MSYILLYYSSSCYTLLIKVFHLKRETVKRPSPITIEKILWWIGKSNWYVVITIIFGIIVFEIFEIIQKQDTLSDPYHIVELLLYIAFLTLLGVLVHFLVRANSAQMRTMQILEYKHNISLQLTELESWEALTSELLKIPNTITSITGSRLFVRNPISGALETVADWNGDETQAPDFHHNCVKCLQKRSNSNYQFSACSANAIYPIETLQEKEYCLPINYANNLFAIIQFKLKKDEQLSRDQIETFENISPEISLALKASQERKNFDEMRSAETALAERHSVSSFLHDHLSQNLAFICLKLDQLSKEGECISEEFKKADLPHMLEAANQSYEILRDMLETMHPETTPRLINLIKEHANREAEKAHFEISIETIGREFPVSLDVQKAVFYVFREALSNIVKHADAKSVKVFMNWEKECLNVTITDDGVGFDPQNLDGNKHLGLVIMRERVDKVGGRIDVRSSKGSGTEIKIFVPVLSLKKTGN